MQGRIQIVRQIPINVTITGAVMIPSLIPHNSMKDEYPMDESKFYRSLTWRDFTINMDIYDDNYKDIRDVQVMEYGTTFAGIRTPNNSLTFLYNKNNMQPYQVGSSFDVRWNENDYHPSTPIRTRDAPLNMCDTVIYLRRIGAYQYHYCIILVNYNDGSSVYKMIYTYGVEKIEGMAEFITRKITVIEAWAGRFHNINLFEIIEKNRMHYVTTGTNTPLDLEYIDSQFYNLWQNIYTSIWDAIKITGTPVKMTIFDPQGDAEFCKNLYLDGRPMNQRMDISYEMFLDGRVVFDARDMKPGQKYEIHINLWDMLYGIIRLDAQE